LRSKTQPASPFKGGEPVVHHECAARALERLGILCYDVAKPMKECGCQETVFTNSQVGTKTGGRPTTHVDVGGNVLFLETNNVDEIKNAISKVQESYDTFKKAAVRGKDTFMYSKIAERCLI
jgi:hypothetical protein